MDNIQQERLAAMTAQKQQELAELKRLRAAGKTLREIEAATGWPRSSIHVALKHLDEGRGFTMRPNGLLQWDRTPKAAKPTRPDGGYTPELIDAAIKAATTTSVRKAAKELNIPQGTLSSWARAMSQGRRPAMVEGALRWLTPDELAAHKRRMLNSIAGRRAMLEAELVKLANNVARMQQQMELVRNELEQLGDTQ